MTFTKALQVTKEGVLLQLHVIPGSADSVFPAGYNPWRNRLEMKVKAEATHNKANDEVRETIASFFHCSQKNISISSGQKTREKTIVIRNITKETMMKKLGEYLHEP